MLLGRKSRLSLAPEDLRTAMEMQGAVEVNIPVSFTDSATHWWHR